jgi:hypothetical protein
VIWVDAAFNSADVIEYHAVRDRSAEQLIGHAMGQPDSGALSPVDHSVAFGIEKSLPQPASAIWLWRYMSPETLKKRCVGRH